MKETVKLKNLNISCASNVVAMSACAYQCQCPTVLVKFNQ